MNKENIMLEAALNYEKMGLSVIPVGKDKKPLVEWKKYQLEQANEEQIKEWFIKSPQANIGVVTGLVSKLVVVDIEKDGSVQDLPATVISKTGGDGWHYFFKR